MTVTMAKRRFISDAINSTVDLKEQEKPMFHDFFGTKTTALAPKTTSDPRQGAKAVAASSSSPASDYSGNFHGAISSNFDLGSEREARNHLDGIQLSNRRGDISGSNMINRLTGSKRSNSDSPFMGHEPLDSLHWTKMLCNGPKNFSTSFSPMVNYPSRMHQTSLSRFKGTNIGGPSVLSQTAADEGSRTGIKGPGILSSVNASSEKNPSGIASKGSSKLDYSTPLREDVTPGSGQMTIFYAGEAHVFDDVHPKKADVIMALAGSKGGSWSTIFSPRPTMKKLGSESFRSSEESEGNLALGHELHGSFSVTDNLMEPSPVKETSHKPEIIKEA